ncbi:MAG: thiamine-binding protein [Spirochaetales bacterium]|nr:thiamine-binding protein [Spirochaetales bacterium]
MPWVNKDMCTGCGVCVENCSSDSIQIADDETIIEADSLSNLFEIAKRLHEAVPRCDVKKVVTSIKIDDRKDKKLSIPGKIKSVRDKLNNGK